MASAMATSAVRSAWLLSDGDPDPGTASNGSGTRRGVSSTGMG